jgi:branched-chain amino acid transport system substrate-binding protein
VTQDFIPATGADVAEGILGTVAGVPYANLTGKGAEFYTNYKAKFNAEPDPYAIYGYDAMQVALAAIEKAGTKDRKAILAAVAGTKDFAGALGTWSFDANGDTSLTEIGGYKVVSGRWVWQKSLSAGD